MKRILLTPFVAVVLLTAGCSTSNQQALSESAPPPGATANTGEEPKPTPSKISTLDGSWTGRELTPDHDGPATLKVSGGLLEFHGPEDNDWIKGTVTLNEDTHPKRGTGVITDCASVDYIGKKCNFIFKIEKDTLTICGYSPDDAEFPAKFDAAGAREFVFTKN